jgi:hypothetical protein
LRIKGEFLEVMQMENYPFDIQALTFTIGVSARRNGPFPVDFIADKRAKKSVQPDGFALVETEYRIQELVLRAGESGTEERRFPRLHASLMVQRRPGYALINVALPMAGVATLCFVQFLLPVTDITDRLSISLTLLLTAAAYKFAISTMIPAISYLTMLDRYVLVCTGVIFAIVLESAVLYKAAESDPKAARNADLGTATVLFGLFMIFHVWFAYRAGRPIRRKTGAASDGAKYKVAPIEPAHSA